MFGIWFKVTIHGASIPLNLTCLKKLILISHISLSDFLFPLMSKKICLMNWMKLLNFTCLLPCHGITIHCMQSWTLKLKFLTCKQKCMRSKSKLCFENKWMHFNFKCFVIYKIMKIFQWCKWMQSWEKNKWVKNRKLIVCKK